MDPLDAKIRALSSFFHPMPIKPAKKTDAKPTSSSKSKTIPKKEVSKKPVKKSKKVITSDESTSEAESSESSDSEPIVRKKSTKDKKKPKIVTSESESDDEIAVETVITKRHDDIYAFDKLSDGLVSIAQQMAKSNEVNVKLLELMSKMFDKLELRVEKESTVKDVFDAAEDVIKSGGSIIIGDAPVVDETNTHRFGSIGEFTKNVGKFTSPQSFNKLVSNDDDEEIE